MSDERLGMNPVYSVRLHPDDEITARHVAGSPDSVRLSLSMRDFQSLELAQQIRPQEATLAIHMRREAALAIFSQIQNLAQTLGWPLPKAGEPPF